MSITRLQQARQMFRYGGDTMGGPNDKSNNNSGGNGGGRPTMADVAGPATTSTPKDTSTKDTSDARENYISKQYKNLEKPTITLGSDKFGNLIKVKTTYQDKRNRQNVLDALNKKGISSFDSRVNKAGFNFLDPKNFTNTFAPQQPKKFGIMDLIMIAASGGVLGPKIATGTKMFNTAKQVGNLLETIGLTDKNVVDSFTSNFSDKFSGFGKGKKSTKSTTTKDKDIFTSGGGDGIEGLGNNDALNQEYLLLLNKFNTGVFTDADQVRFTFLKNMLGK